MAHLRPSALGGLEAAHSLVVLMEIFVHGAELVLNDGVRLSLVLQHLLHQVELALHQAARAQRRVQIRDVTHLAQLANGLQGVLEVEELG